MIRFSLRALLALFFLLPLVATNTASAQSGQEVRVRTTLQDGTPYYDACYQLVDFSNIGCDENRDGVVTFADVPPGDYLLVQTADIPYAMVSPVARSGMEITVYDNDNNDVGVMLMEGTTSTDVSLITRDPDSGKLLPGACYELVGYSNIGCDENKDGSVDFADIPYGTYTVHQTTAPQGYQVMGDYDISVEPVVLPGYGSAKITLVQAPTQGDATRGQVSVVFLDFAGQERVASAENCVSIQNLSESGCDIEAADGQVDFVDVTIADPNALIPKADSLVCPYVAGVNPEQKYTRVQYGANTWVVVMSIEATAFDCSN